MKSFNVDDDFKIKNTKRQSYLQSFNTSNYNPYGVDPGSDEDDSKLEFLDDRYDDFIHKDEIYFRTKRSHIFNPTLISQCLEYESTGDINSDNCTSNKQIYGYSGE